MPSRRRGLGSGYAGNPKAIAVLMRILLDGTASLPTRSRAMTALATNASGEQALLNAIKEKKLSSGLTTSAARLLLRSINSKSRAFAAAHLGLPEPGKHKPAMSLARLIKEKPNIKNGPVIFKKAGCIKCHKVGDQGVEFGPDLSAIGSTVARKEMFVSILAPSASIKFGYEGLNITLDDSEHLTGYRTNENDTTLRLRMAGGIQRDIAKTNIHKRASSELSLMPQVSTWPSQRKNSSIWLVG